MSEWQQVTLGEICEKSGGDIQTGPFGSQLHASDYVALGNPSVMPQNIGDNYIEPAGIAMVSESDTERLSRYKLHEGDIVYSRRGDVERRALVRKENEGWLCGTGCLRVRVGRRDSYEPRFISYALGLDRARKWIRRHAVGATMLNLNTSILSSVPLDVPGIAEQRRIAEVLGALDDKIAANHRVTGLTRHFLDGEFVRMGVDSNYRSVDGATLGDIVEIYPKLQPPSSDEPAYLEMKNLPDQRMTATDWGYRPASGGARFQNGDTLLARITPCLENGKVGYVDFLNRSEVGVGSTEFIVMRPRPGIPSVLPYFLAKSSKFRDFAIKHMSGTSGRQRLAATDLVEYPLYRPDAQKLARFESLSSALMERVKAAVDESRKLSATRDELLPLLMAGKVRVRDAEKVVEGVV